MAAPMALGAIGAANLRAVYGPPQPPDAAALQLETAGRHNEMPSYQSDAWFRGHWEWPVSCGYKPRSLPGTSRQLPKTSPAGPEPGPRRCQEGCRRDQTSEMILSSFEFRCAT